MLKAVIFDLDGTVLANENVYGEAFRSVLLDLGVKVDELRPHTTGIGVGPNWVNFIKKYNIKTSLSIDDLTLGTQLAYHKLIDKVELTRGFPEFAFELKDHGVRLALATSNSAKMVKEISDKFLLGRFFEVITTYEEVDNPKPDPSLFLKSAEKLNVSSSDCIVIEDAVAGIEAARRAGMKVVGIASDSNSPTILMSDLGIHDFTELSFDKLIGIM
jgi:HAD superfamily hydrolase (TIGR01509 family)